MSIQADYSAEEWNQIVAGPVIAGTTIIAADPAVFGSIKESAAMAKAMVQYGESSPVELIKAISASVKAGHKYQQPQIPKDQGSAGAMKALIDECRQAVDIVQSKSPEEAESYSQFLMDVARITAEASKEGGFLSIGAVRVSKQEVDALERLSAALNIQPGSDEAAENS
jgi:hypothetical protein